MLTQISTSRKSTGPSTVRSVSRRSPSRSSIWSATRLREIRPRRFRLARLIFGADDDPVAAARPDIVAHGGGEIERRDAIGRADLDNAARLGRAAQLIAEICLVAIERDELVAQELFELVLVRRIRPRTPCLELPEHRDLRVAPGVQAGKQALQHRVLDHRHIALLHSAASTALATSAVPL
jgi:hypothetical protein